MPLKADLPQGTLDMLILKVVALEPLHGYGIARRLEQVSNGCRRDPFTLHCIAWRSGAG